MPDDFQYDVFLSHSSKDKKVVRDIAERLKKDGVRVWFDEWILKPGDSIPAKIEEGLEHSRVLVLCMSANAFGSDWAKLESGTFRFRDPLNKERRFLPVRLDDAPIKGSLAQFLYVNWQTEEREQEYRKLLSACQVSSHQVDVSCLLTTPKEANAFLEQLAQIMRPNTGLLTPGTKPTPSELSQASSIADFIILMGADCTCIAKKFPHVVINQNGEDMMVVGKEGDEFWLNAKMFSADGRIIAEVVRNTFTINEKNCFRIERSPHRLLIFNEEARPVIDLELLNKTCASLRGHFYLRHGASVKVGDGFEFDRGRTKSGNITMKHSAFGGLYV